MSNISNKLFSYAASAIVFSMLSAAAHAEIDALTLAPGDLKSGSITSTYTFNSSMILNSIGFVTNGYNPEVWTYSIKGTTFDVNTAELTGHIDGVRWLNLSSGIQMNASDTVSVYTQGYAFYGVSPDTDYQTVTSLNSNANVSFNSNYGGGLYTNSNIRVSNPSSNVAPEPGSIALLLTGGGALAGIALRRRRNAA